MIFGVVAELDDLLVQRRSAFETGVAYDLARNMTTIPGPASPTSGDTVTYDAWIQRVPLVDATSGNLIQQNQYDGRSDRVAILN